jgi:hypothetical protein
MPRQQESSISLQHPASRTKSRPLPAPRSTRPLDLTSHTHRLTPGSAQYNGAKPMINALARLGKVEPGPLPEAIRAMGISDRPGWMALFSTHPPIEQRIAALQAVGK